MRTNVRPAPGKPVSVPAQPVVADPVPATEPVVAVKVVDTAVVASKVVDTAASVSWDDLPVAQVAAYQRAPSKVDLEATTPQAIKDRVTAGFAASDTSASGPVWFVQLCGTKDRAESFVKMAKKYAAFVGKTFRGTVVTDGELNKLVQLGKVPADTASLTVVSYSIRKLETRSRAPKPTVVEATDAEKQATSDAADAAVKAVLSDEAKAEAAKALDAADPA